MNPQRTSLLFALAMAGLFQGCDGIPASADPAASPTSSKESLAASPNDTLWKLSYEPISDEHSTSMPHTRKRCFESSGPSGSPNSAFCVIHMKTLMTGDTVWVDTPTPDSLKEILGDGCNSVDLYAALWSHDDDWGVIPGAFDSVLTMRCPRSVDPSSPRRDTLWKDTIVHTAGLDKVAICNPPSAGSPSVSCLRARFEKLPTGICERIRILDGVPRGRQYSCSDPRWGMGVWMDTTWSDTVVHTASLGGKQLCHPWMIDARRTTCLHTRYEPLPAGICEHIVYDMGFPGGMEYTCADSLAMVWPLDN